LPPAAFISFLQNHDTPARAISADVVYGRRMDGKHAFPFFCDFPPELVENVITGRLLEFL